jgi:hypothetical protein
MKNFLFLMLFFLFLGTVLAQEKKRTLLLNMGTQNTWERDFAYSPLVYAGSNAGFTLDLRQDIRPISGSSNNGDLLLKPIYR